MTVVFGPQSVTQAVGTRILGPFTISDSVTGFRITAARWNGQGTVALAVQLSFDSGATWRDVCAVGAVSRTQLNYKGRTGQFLQYDGLWRLCSCGEVYVPGHPANSQLLMHSDKKGVDSQTVGSWPDLSGVTFHLPDNQPATGLPLRQVRGIITIANASVTSTVTVETLP